MKLQLNKTFWTNADNLKEMKEKNKAAIARFTDHPYAVKKDTK